MRKTIAILLIFLLAGLLVPAGTARAAPPGQAAAEFVTPEMARAAAESWIIQTIHDTGSWGGAPAASVVDVQPLMKGDRQVGYYLAIDPAGYIITPLRTELTPVKAFTVDQRLDPASDGQNVAGLVKDSLAAALDQIEAAAGPVAQASTADFARLLERDYRSLWADWSDPQALQKRLAGGETSNYSSGQILLETSWHQGDPFWDNDPVGSGGQTVVGCVATAGAQILAYWDWPLVGNGSHSYAWSGDDSCGPNVGGGTLSATFNDIYDWGHMANRYVWDAGQARWEDENGSPITQAHLDAASELSYEFGVAVNMDYGACGSSAYTWDADPAYSNYFRYDEADTIYRTSYNPTTWFSMIQLQLNRNRPVHYKVTGHSIVGDGWRVSGGLNQIHFNYGWDSGDTTWYTVDALLLGDPSIEYVVLNIVPINAMGPILTAGTYARVPTFPYRYVDQDIAGGIGGEITFSAGQNIQFLPRVHLTCNGNNIRFLGVSGYPIRLYSRGILNKGITVYNGAVKLYTNGSIRVP